MAQIEKISNSDCHYKFRKIELNGVFQFSNRNELS